MSAGRLLTVMSRPNLGLTRQEPAIVPPAQELPAALDTFSRNVPLGWSAISPTATIAACTSYSARRTAAYSRSPAPVSRTQRVVRWSLRGHGGGELSGRIAPREGPALP